MSFERVATELLLQEKLREFCGLLSSHQIRHLLFKGAALAYTLYEDPASRPRNDVDVLIAFEDLNKLDVLLRRDGYEWQPTQKEILGQTIYIKKMGDLRFIVDVHWHLFTPFSLRNIFAFEELWSTRKTVRNINALTVSDLHAVVISSVHWVAHHLAYPEPHWSEDLRRLTENRDSLWWAQLKELCLRKGLQKIVHETLLKSQISSPWSQDELQIAREPLEYWLSPCRSGLKDFLFDLNFMNYRQGLLFLYRHLFPKRDFMRLQFAVTSLNWLPLLYVYRWFKGFRRVVSPW